MRSVVLDYSWGEQLTPPEQAALAACANNVRNKPILDIGVGAGRTVKALCHISREYVGVDYVEEMVAFCRARFPGVRFEHADARSLMQFADNSFSLIVFACNGISMVDHVGRLAILKEVYRLLTPGGVFLFSTYNIDNLDHKSIFKFPDFSATLNPAKIMVRGVRFFHHTIIRLINRLRFKRLQQHFVEFSIINDVCHDYATMLYYISLSNQRKQLETIGFMPNAEAFDLGGRLIGSNATDDSITLLARKSS